HRLAAGDDGQAVGGRPRAGRARVLGPATGGPGQHGRGGEHGSPDEPMAHNRHPPVTAWTTGPRRAPQPDPDPTARAVPGGRSPCHVTSRTAAESWPRTIPAQRSGSSEISPGT